jgi:hypothetical protein
MGKKSPCYSKFNCEGISPPWIPSVSSITKSALMVIIIPGMKVCFEKFAIHRSQLIDRETHILGEDRELKTP